MTALTIPRMLPGTAWDVTLDPPAIADADRVELDINSGTISIDQAGIDWGDAAIQEYLADQQVGSALVDYRLPNRTVSIPLSIGDGTESGFYDARAALQQKVALFQREGGWLKRDAGVALYADVVNATLTFPDQWGATGFMENTVKLTLECLPDFRGDEVTLDSISCTGECVAVLQQSAAQAVIGGDHPGPVRIVVTDTSVHSQESVSWGFRSRYSDSTDTALLSYLASSLFAAAGATVTADAAAYGGSAIVWHPGSAMPMTEFMVLGINRMSNFNFTHIGSYQVLARVKATGTSNPVNVRLGWGGLGGMFDALALNDQVALPGFGNYYVLNLGTVRVDKPPVGAHSWYSQIQGEVGDSGASISVDKVWLIPLDEAAGYLTRKGSHSVIIGGESVEICTDGAVSMQASGTLAWTYPSVIGDLPRIPPSGMEGRPVELIVKPSRGDREIGDADSGIDTFTVQVFYRPSYLFPA